MRSLRETFTPFRLPALLVLLAIVGLAAACSSGDSSTSTPGASGGAPTGSSGATAPPGTIRTATPAPTPTTVKPAICAPADKTVGLVSQVAFNGQDGIYTPGQTVEITMTIGNCGDTAVVLNFATTQRYDFHIVDKNGVQLWSSADGQSYGQTAGTETIPSGGEVTYKETWNQKDRSGNQVPEDTYKVSTFSMGCKVVGQTSCGFGPVRDIIITSTPPSPLPSG